jgi:hypothetical protein
MARRSKAGMVRDQNVLVPEDRLLGLLARSMDAGMFGYIAAADHGNDQAQHLVALKDFHGGRINFPLGEHPLRVLDLISGGEPDDPGRNTVAPGKRGHQMRAFCCAALLRDACARGSVPAPSRLPDTLVQLIVSMRRLALSSGGEGAALVGALLAALPEVHMDAAERVLLESGLLWFLLQDAENGDDVIVPVLERIGQVTRTHFDHLSRSWGLIAHELALPDMMTAGAKVACWGEIADVMCATDYPQLSKRVGDRVGIHAELLRRAIAG